MFCSYGTFADVIAHRCPLPADCEDMKIEEWLRAIYCHWSPSRLHKTVQDIKIINLSIKTYYSILISSEINFSLACVEFYRVCPIIHIP